MLWIIGIIVFVLVAIGIFQKKQEQEVFRESTKLKGGFRYGFPNLIDFLENNLKMVLVTDTGDDFFYQIELIQNSISIGYFRIGRKVDYGKNHLLYSELIIPTGEKREGMPIVLEPDVIDEIYWLYIQKSVLKIFESDSEIKSHPFFKQFLKLEKVKQEDLLENKKNDLLHTTLVKEIFNFISYEGIPTRQLISSKFYINDKLIQDEHMGLIYDGFVIPNFTEYFYNQDGTIYFTKYTDPECIKTRWYNYNNKGMLVNIDTDFKKIEDGIIIKYTSNTYLYNDKGLVTEEREYYNWGDLLKVVKNEYDELGNKISEYIEVEDLNITLTLRKFDSKKRILEQLEYEGKERKIYSEDIIVYDDTNNCIQTTSKKSYGTFVHSQFFNKDLLIKEEYFEFGELKKTLLYYYENTKLIRQEQFVKNKIVHWSEFLYEYN